jgi:hypothetical protein
MIMDGSPTATSSAHARGDQSADLEIAHVRERLALLENLKAGIEELKRDPDSGMQFSMNDPTDAAVARAAANIALWRSYLPEDCVAAMIAAGWQWST